MQHMSINLCIVHAESITNALACCSCLFNEQFVLKVRNSKNCYNQPRFPLTEKHFMQLQLWLAVIATMPIT